jgi:hypothetical protein
MRQCLE